MERGIQVDINHSSFSKFKSSKSGSPRSVTEAKSLSDATKLKESTQSSAAASLKQLDLKEGQTIKGQIIDHRYNEVRVQLEPGKQIITAKLTGDVPLSIGQEAQFQVTEDTTDHLVLRYLPNEHQAPTDITIKKALTASSLPLTDRNKAIVEELLNHRMPIDKQTLQTLVKLSHTNREASPLTLVLMYKNNMPMTSANIKQFEAYQNGTHQLLNDIQNITKSISLLLKQPDTLLTNTAASLIKQTSVQQSTSGMEPSALQAAILSEMDGPLKEVFQINNKLIDILFSNSNQSETTGAATLPLHNFLNQEELSLLGKTIEQQIANYSSFPVGIPSDIARQIMEGTISSEDAIKIITNLSTEASEQITSYSLLESLSQQQLNNESTPILQGLLEKYSFSQDNPAKLASLLNPSDRVALLDMLKTFPEINNRNSRIGDGTLSVQDTLTYINENLSQVEESVSKNLLQSPEYLKLLEGAFHEKWTLTPEKLAKKASVSDLYQNLQEDLEKLSTLEKTDKISSEALRLQEPVKNMQENLRFMKELNEMYTYLQLPIQFKERDVHSDLYVFTRKNSQQGKDKNLSVLLHLTMDNLGPLNIHIQMDHNLIRAKFYLEDSRVEQLISDNLPSLSDALKKKGFQLQAEILDTYEKPDFSKDFIEQSSIDASVQRYTFDIRT
jgi:hypothetical protein